jgi:hypothetical protein
LSSSLCRGSALHVNRDSRQQLCTEVALFMGIEMIVSISVQR